MAGSPVADSPAVRPGPGPVGVLALQGDYREHAAVLESFGAEVITVRRPEELARVSGLVIPGGESSVMDKLSRMFGLAGPLKQAIAAGLPVYGTCAGLIMLADRMIDGIAGQQSLGGLDIAVRRNAFGRQRESFEVDVHVPELGDPPVHAVFIRAPVVEEVGERASVLAALSDGRVIAVEQGNLLGTSFHPEMTSDFRFHRRFHNRVLEVGFHS
ncbi:pyridoxal 5'-phosphate synthase glutaminase subunit PdxT [Subtercola boreus]|uniref:Pyridoxal 5'-phosphate synthase subunit PdxT n=1 Tax=Subtercola boreus TaxID=120213 RepID=A0A3E0VIF6_9MICO|nr:pyridoxal 5'-phosphate synthase glutaminase subunit PdxT [Subtercola boreus]RFA09429.1 pyridoxal 5'-phosphate synthase glutaminase subunit PdxT [Subtercola boreus]TQL53526.1 pyridoxal phosphate synthase yaaE subunit [Subtercola boreus]